MSYVEVKFLKGRKEYSAEKLAQKAKKYDKRKKMKRAQKARKESNLKIDQPKVILRKAASLAK